MGVNNYNKRIIIACDDRICFYCWETYNELKHEKVALEDYKYGRIALLECSCDGKFTFFITSKGEICYMQMIFDAPYEICENILAVAISSTTVRIQNIRYSSDLPVTISCRESVKLLSINNEVIAISSGKVLLCFQFNFNSGIESCIKFKNYDKEIKKLLLINNEFLIIQYNCYVVKSILKKNNDGFIGPEEILSKSIGNGSFLLKINDEKTLWTTKNYEIVIYCIKANKEIFYHQHPKEILEINTSKDGMYIVYLDILGILHLLETIKELVNLKA